ncbi:MAG: dephospho-CoA kinase, partial [Planctomycetes bacterium]|nr:dephospho-CoA kinase [Planctomycetota bacterium]
AQLGVPVIDADVVAREVVEPGQPALAGLVELVGEDVLDDSGRLDRQRVRERVFQDDDLRRRIEALLHPLIRAEMERRVASVDTPYCIEAIPLLIETNQASRVGRVLLVDLPVERQVERTLARDGGNEATVRAIIAAQATREQRLAVADDVIDNDVDIDAVRRRVAELHQRYTAAAKAANLPARRHR